MLLDKIHLDDLEVGLKADNWEDAIRKASKILLAKGAILQSYVEGMINAVKENGPYIVIAPHVALAHTRPEHGANALGISFSLLEAPIPFGSDTNDPVKLIITFSSVDNESHLELLSELVDVLMDEERMEKIFSAKSKDAFYDSLTD